MLRMWITPAFVAAWTSLILIALLALFPYSVMDASVKGLSIWWEVLFPALFPFFVISELLLGFGIVHFFGTILDPVMRPMFRLPGIAGFVVAMGFISGYPVGPRLTARLWEQKLVNRAEGERLAAFTTSSDPIFLIGAVSVGFFHNAALAPVLAAAHYGGALLIGFFMRFHEPRSPVTVESEPRRTRSPFRLKAAARAMHAARLADGRDLGVLLQDSVQSALRLMMVVGGLVVFFSVVMALLDQTGLVGILSFGLEWSLHAAGLPQQLSAPFVNGLFEVTLGARSAGEAGGGSLLHQAAAAAWVLSWGGLSVHAQIASLLSHTDLRYKPFFLARLLHAFLSFGLVYLLWGWLGPLP